MQDRRQTRAGCLGRAKVVAVVRDRAGSGAVATEGGIGAEHGVVDN